MSNKITCTCGHSWNKSSSSKKDMRICHICGKDNTMKNGGWLDAYDEEMQLGGNVYSANYVPQAQLGISTSDNTSVRKPIIQNVIGLAKDPDVMKYNEVKKDEQWKDPYTFLMNWYTDPETKKRLKAQGAPEKPMTEALNQKRYNNYDDWRSDSRDKNRKDAEAIWKNDYSKANEFTNFLNQSLDSRYDDLIRTSSGFHDAKDSTVALSNFGSDRTKENMNVTAVHELTHATPLDNFYIDYFKKNKPKDAKWLEEDYFSKNPVEIYPRIQDLRYQLWRDKKIAPGTKITPSLLEGYNNNSDLNLRNYYSPEELSKIMNEVAYTPNVNNPIRQAQNGLEASTDGFTDQGFNYNGAWGGTMQYGGNLPGAVGSMYAREGAPSNGPYAKKTLASAQDGLSVDEQMAEASTNMWGYPTEPNFVEAYKKPTKKTTSKKTSAKSKSVKEETDEPDSFEEKKPSIDFRANRERPQMDALRPQTPMMLSRYNPYTGYIREGDSDPNKWNDDRSIFSDARAKERGEKLWDGTKKVTALTQFAPLIGLPSKVLNTSMGLTDAYYSNREKDPINTLINIAGAMPSRNKYISGIQALSDLTDNFGFEKKPEKKQNGGEMSFYQNGLDWTPRNISRDGSEIPKAQMGTMVTPLDFSKPLGTLEGVSEVMSAPARTATYLLTGKYQDPSQALGIKNPWGALAADMVLDPMNLVGAGIAGKATKAAVKASMESGALSKAYKYNPWAFKANPEAAYRGIGEAGYNNLLSSGEVRSLKQNAYPEPYFAKGQEPGNYAKGYMIELNPNEPMKGVGAFTDYHNDLIGTPVNKVTIDNPNLKILKKDWLKGYKEVKKPKKKEGGEITKDDNGYWNPENWGKPVEIGSNEITMQGVNQPLIGVSNTGDVKMMYPGEDYKFKGKKVTEYPVKKNGGWLDEL